MGLATVIGAFIIIGIVAGGGWFMYKKGWCCFCSAMKKKVQDVEMQAPDKRSISAPIPQQPHFEQQQMYQHPPMDPQRQWQTQYQQPQKQQAYYTQGAPQGYPMPAPQQAHTRHISPAYAQPQNEKSYGLPASPSLPKKPSKSSSARPSTTRKHKQSFSDATES